MESFCIPTHPLKPTVKEMENIYITNAVMVSNVENIGWGRYKKWERKEQERWVTLGDQI